MLRVKKTLLIFSLMLTINNLSFSEGKILKKELPKNEREFFEGGRLIDLQDEIKESETNIDTSELPKFFVKTIILKTPTITIKPLVNPKKIDKILAEYKNKEIGQIDDVIEDKILQLISNNINKIKLLRINWFGGEPLLVKNRVMSITKSIDTICKNNNVNIQFSIITNGYNIDEVIAKFFKEYKFKNIK